MRRLQRKILLIPICFVLLRTPETVYRVLEYLHPSPAGGAACEADASLASSVVGMVLQGMQAVTNPAQGVATSIIFVWSSPTYRERLRRAPVAAGRRTASCGGNRGADWPRRRHLGSTSSPDVAACHQSQILS